VERRGKQTSEVEVGAAAAAVSQKIESALQDGH
jgi:hypothetical protein